MLKFTGKLMGKAFAWPLSHFGMYAKSIPAVSRP
jgi:hypothetical protein